MFASLVMTLKGSSLNYPSRQGGLQSFFVNKFCPFKRIISASVFFRRSFMIVEYPIVNWLMCQSVFAVLCGVRFAFPLKLLNRQVTSLFETAPACGHGTVAFRVWPLASPSISS
jgi:hypothetical protein